MRAALQAPGRLCRRASLSAATTVYHVERERSAMKQVLEYSAVITNNVSYKTELKTYLCIEIMPESVAD